MKITIICYDLGHNALGRAYLLGKVLQRSYEVEIVGFHFREFGNSIWTPCKTKDFNYKAFKGLRFPLFFRSASNMINSISGDVIYASKLMMPSYGIGIIEKLIKKKPLILDIDDYEISWRSHYDSFKKLYSIINPIGPLNTEIIEKFADYADFIIINI
jgi:hypothetical protein